ncbi:aspartate/ornithine carbamoyltransferase carbamoyl-P binding domain protein [Xylanimonas cellulosilytica DSM 15894]|uniref:Aspartate/ornithine carbamoyltransferase carbamoyl-P binding domain protein n=1 Tax=Xylanimonas cellulosilytica (strain DSM 15894 / JCM 12276 / CECT 5975 / KCTC 9989 / LMG 20990 / NBRC 107835 / XIL07) TaxID=446471 RepID=D1BT39_XYLCX|nr:ornithine carbamoyltransferase [Xylanimonas cellulosilytica]ACZ30881.1 aspartate/ornithine carbamoyltransferase carbamoyl-P binding domain protein [Xylanimonas cellulosilytica DSM 15894]
MPRSLVRLDDWSADDVEHVFALADAYRAGAGPTTDGCAVMFFPSTSLRTRVTFERGAHLIGLQPVLFPPETLDKPEDPRDVVRYLANWADVVVARHPDIAVLERLAAVGSLPVVNAMTNVNHPCEVLADVYALAQTRDVLSLGLVFVGADGNISRAWAEIARVLGLDLLQCCPRELATPGLRWSDDVEAAVRDADVVLTDGVGRHAEALAPYQVTAELMTLARPSAVLNPCPPFTRGQEVAADVVDQGGPFVGYGFKRSLLHVQQAVLATCLGLG